MSNIQTSPSNVTRLLSLFRRFWNFILSLIPVTVPSSSTTVTQSLPSDRKGTLQEWGGSLFTRTDCGLTLTHPKIASQRERRLSRIQEKSRSNSLNKT